MQLTAADQHGADLGQLAALACQSVGLGVGPRRTQPSAPINVTAAITATGVQVAPRRFGAGPIRLIVSNQTASRRAITFEPAAGAHGTTESVRRASTATIELSPTTGAYRLAASGSTIEPATVRVGPARPSAQNELLLP